jgi:hypothetical protein
VACTSLGVNGIDIIIPPIGLLIVAKFFTSALDFF